MPDKDERETSRSTRRSVLRGVGAGAIASVGLAGMGSAGAEQSNRTNDIDKEACDCSYETKCMEGPCADGPYAEYQRECCTCDDNGTICEDWTHVGCCPFQPT